MGLCVTDGSVLRVIPGDLPPDGVGQLFSRATSVEMRLSLGEEYFILCSPSSVSQMRVMLEELTSSFTPPNQRPRLLHRSILGSGFGFISG